MKINLSFKKNISGFKPNEHWKIILVVSFVLFISAIAYNVYLYTFAGRQVNTVLSAASTTVPTELTALASSEKIQEYFSVYKQRQQAYAETIKSLTSGNKPVVASSSATTSTSTVVATTTNQ